MVAQDACGATFLLGTAVSSSANLPDTTLGSFVTTWRAMLADAGVVLLLFVGSIIYSFFYPLPYSHETVQQVPVAIVDQDHSAISRQITRYAMASPYIKVVPLNCSDPREAQDLLWKNEIAGMLFIPSGLESKVLSGRKVEVQISGNGVYMMMNRAALNGLTGAVGTVSAGIEIKRLAAATPSSEQMSAQRQPLRLEAVALFNARDGYGAYIVPGVAVLIVQQTLLLAMSLMFGTWRERGDFPVRRSTPAFWGMLLAFASMAFANCLYFFGFVMWWQDYPRAGNFGGLLLFSILFALCVAALGMLLGSLFRTRERGAQLLISVSLPLLFLSGLSWPGESMPWILQGGRWIIPSTAGIQGFIALNQLGASLHEIAPELLVLIGLTVVSIAAALKRWSERA